MFSLNRAQIIGNLTRDPELRYTPAGQSVASFGVATNRRWKNKEGDMQEDTQFHEIVAWGKLAEICQKILAKGKKVYVEGRLQTRSWEAADGSKRQRTEIVAENIIALTPKEPTTEALEETLEAELAEPTEKTAKETAPSQKVKEKQKSEKPSTTPQLRGREPQSPSGPEALKGRGQKDKEEEEIDLDDIPF